MEKHPLQIKIPDLQTSPEVQDAVEKKERLTDEKIPNDPNERIEVYMERLEKIFLNPDERVRERNLEMLRDKIYEAFIIKRENIPESYFELQKRIARERGQTIEEIPQDMKERMIDTVIEDQRHSLDSWIKYLTSDDAMYPTWYKYFVFRNIIKLSQFDKELGKFKVRTDSTTAPFPDRYEEPLAKICDLYQEVQGDNKKLKDPETQAAFSKKFPSLYAELIQKSLEANLENKEEIRGEWIKYQKGDMRGAERLYQSLEDKGTGWCTAGKATAEAQVESGDFHVYYTYDAENKPTQPRIAIRMEEDRIAEVRGRLPHQSLEPQMNDVLDTKLQEFGSEAHKFKKKSADMKLLTEIAKKTEANQPLTKEDLVFLYEMEGSIEGFGYEKDPRVGEMIRKRNSREDAPIVFGCSSEEIAWEEKEITQNTKVFIGTLFNGIFNKNFEHILTSFPEGKLQKYDIEIGGKTKEELKSELQEKQVYISDWAHQIIDSPDFTTSKNIEKLNLVRLTVKDLGFGGMATTDQIYKRAEELGLDLCPAEVGPRLRLSYSGEDWMYIAMKQITDRDRSSSVFHLYRYGAKLRLVARNALPDYKWDLDNLFVFSIRKS